MRDSRDAGATPAQEADNITTMRNVETDRCMMMEETDRVYNVLATGQGEPADSGSQ